MPSEMEGEHRELRLRALTLYTHMYFICNCEKNGTSHSETRALVLSYGALEHTDARSRF